VKSYREKIVVVAGIAAASAVFAKENYHEKTLNADTKETFEQVATNVRKEMSDGGRYEYASPDERKTINVKLSEMEALFAESGTVQAMKQDSKVKLFNDQEVVNSILTHRDRDRVICKNEAPVGSHIPVTSCHTYGQEEDARHGTRNQLDEWLRLGCVNAGCGASPQKKPTGSGDSH
jgi:hypothetical protein